MSMFQSNIFTIRENRFTNPKFRKDVVNGFSFNGKIKSDNFEDLKFTNFTKSDRTKKYSDLKNICTEIKNNYCNLDKLFTADEIDIQGDIPKLDRIHKIIEKVNNIKLNKKELILKYKNKSDKEIQFFIKNEKGQYKLYLVDLYHLGIEGENRKTKRKDLSGIYKAHKDFTHNINSLNIN